MNYEETLQYLYRQLPVFQQVGLSAYKPGLGNSLALDALVGHPHRRYATIHVAGTNGKGSTSHVLAAVLQKSGYGWDCTPRRIWSISESAYGSTAK